MWTPSPKFRHELGYNLNFIELPYGRSFTTRIITKRASTGCSRRSCRGSNLIQYDNVSEIAGLNMRLNWIPEAGREVFFVINQNLEDFDLDNRSIRQSRT